MSNFFTRLLGVGNAAPQSTSVHHASMPRGRVVAIFIPARDFRGETKAGDLLGMYKQGRRYYIREGNNMLNELCANWESEGLIKINRGK
jgi:hypothetical protein